MVVVGEMAGGEAPRAAGGGGEGGAQREWLYVTVNIWLHWCGGDASAAG